MNKCIQEYVMPKKERDYDNTVLSLRFTSTEAARFWRVMDEAKARNAYIAKSDVYRELLGLKPPDVLTRDEIVFFRSGEKVAREIRPAVNSPHSLKIPRTENPAKRRKVQGG